MYAYRKYICLVFAFLILSGCAPAPIPLSPVPLAPGDVQQIAMGTSLWVLNQVTTGAPSVFALQNADKITMFAAPMSNLQGWGTVVLNLASKMPMLEWCLCSNGTGTYYACRDMGEIVTTALNNGFRMLSPDELPPELKAEIASATSWISQLSNIHMPVLAIPTGMLDLNVLPTPVVR